MPVYEVRPENGGGRSRVLHRNLLLPCSYLPVEAPISASKRIQKGPRKVTKRQPPTEGTSSNADDGMPKLTPHQFEELFESAGGIVREGYEHAQAPAEQDADPFYADDPDQDQGTKDSCEQVAPLNDDVDTVDEGLPRHSQRTSRPPLRMTYDVPGQPFFQPWTTAGVQGISASYPQQILPPYRVPWMLQPVETLLSMFCLHVPTCAVWADDSCTLLLLTSLGKWAVPVNLQELKPRYLFIIIFSRT